MTISLGQPGWLWTAVALLAVCCGLTLWCYRRAAGSLAAQWLPLCLKGVAFLLLLACVVDPLASGVVAKPGANLVAILVDETASMIIADAPGESTRGEQLHTALQSDEGGWQTSLRRDFTLAHYRQQSRLLPWTGDADTLTFNAAGAEATRVCEQLHRRLADKPVAGVLWFTDGLLPAESNETVRGTNDYAGPIYPVIVGTSDRLRDVGIDSVQVSQSPFEDAPVTVLTQVAHRGCNGETLAVRVVTATGEVLSKQQASVTDDAGTQGFRLQLPGGKPGLSFYTIEAGVVQADGEIGSENDTTDINNRKTIVVDRGRERQRVLYVSGRPNWEYKFLQRAIADDPQVQLSALIRIANREAKFDFRGRDGQSSNSLFRGFQADHDAETERYDEPVFVRLNMKDAEELRQGFPATAEELFRFDAVIIDDLEAAFFTTGQQKLLSEFVTQRGGSLLMTGGRDTLSLGGYRRTQIGELLPVWLDVNRGSTASDAANTTQAWRWELTREGRLEPWVRLRTEHAQEQARRAAMPAFQIVSRVGQPKPGATVLAQLLAADGSTQPALVTQRLGNGRTAVLTTGDTWRWAMRAVDEHDDAGRAWRQTLRWLVADVSERVSIDLAAASEYGPAAVRATVRVRNKSFQPTADAAVKLTWSHADHADIELTARPTEDALGEYAVEFLPPIDGGWTVTASAIDNADEEFVQTATAGWVADGMASEFSRLTPNHALLERIARESGGRVLTLEELPDFVDELPTTAVPITEPLTWSIWHQPWVFMLIVGCLAGEWGLRRWRGLR